MQHLQLKSELSDVHNCNIVCKLQPGLLSDGNQSEEMQPMSEQLHHMHQ